MQSRGRSSHVSPRRKRKVGERLDQLGAWLLVLALGVGAIIAVFWLIETQMKGG
jgi:hypothetical protein